MKRSKFFLATSSFVLAIAGVAATKASTHFATGYYYETTAGSNRCAYVAVSTFCPHNEAIQCTTFGGNAMYGTVTEINKKKCRWPLTHN
jgi:hypothetical protein